MNMLGFSVRRWLVMVWLAVAALLAGCSNSDTSSRAGVIAFEESSGVAVKGGNTRDVVLSLQNSLGVSGQRVRVESTDPLLAEVSPSACTLSSSSNESNRCRIRIHALNHGQVMLFARSEGYPDASVPVTVTDTVVYGSLTSMGTSVGSATVSSAATISFITSGAAPYQIPLTAQISGSSGIVTPNWALINFSSAANPPVTFDPPQCAVTSVKPTCNTVVSVPTAITTTVTVQVVGSATTAHDYGSIIVTAVPGATPTFGTITVSTQSGNNVPKGMKAPLFVNWVKPSIPNAVTVTLAIAGNGVSFYNYAPGDNINIKTSKGATCQMSYAGTAATDTLSCGLGLVGEASTGTVVVSASVASQVPNNFAVAPLTLGAVDPGATRRAVTFNNQSSQTITVGITGGAAASTTDTSATPGAATANMKAGAGSMCGPSNPAAACPIGTSCIQGGAAPNTDTSKTPFYCYYDQTTPTNGYEIAPKATTTFEISTSSLSPGGIIWSGNFYARTGCDKTTGVCENATCAGKAGGLSCGPGTGPSPGVNTLAELTFQAYPATDFYDVSIINGANFAMQFGPTGSVTQSSTDPYFCTTAGSLAAQNGGYTSTNTIGLPTATWALSPSTTTTSTTSASFPPGATVTGDASSYFRVVIPSATPPAACTRNTDCAGTVDTTCGFAMSTIKGTTPTFTANQRVCGKPVAWMTADTIWGLNSSATNVAPFAFSTSWSVGTATVSVGDLQLCINNTYSAYSPNGTTSSSPAFPIQPIALACGGVMWGATESPGPLQNPNGNVGLNLTRPSNPVQTANTNWLTYVLPTIRWLKQACPTCYTYAFDDPTSTFTCSNPSGKGLASYGVVFQDLK